MARDTNPHSNATVRSREESAYNYLRRGSVTSAQSGQSGAAPFATVQEAGIPADMPIPVMPTVHGDLYVPPTQAPVAIAPFDRNEYAIVGAPVPDVTTPTLDPGERIISHPISGANVKFNADGSLDISGDTELRINGGTQGAITDVQVNTNTDGDGHVTSVSLDITRESSIKI